MVNLQEVRDYLNQLPTDRVKDVALEIAIGLATRMVQKEKSSQADADTIEDAILTQAGYLAYVAYANEFERTFGEVPGPVLAQLERLDGIAKRFLGYAKRGIGPSKSPLIELPDSYHDMYEAGELKGETI